MTLALPAGQAAVGPVPHALHGTSQEVERGLLVRSLVLSANAADLQEEVAHVNGLAILCQLAQAICALLLGPFGYAARVPEHAELTRGLCARQGHWQDLCQRPFSRSACSWLVFIPCCWYGTAAVLKLNNAEAVDAGATTREEGRPRGGAGADPASASGPDSPTAHALCCHLLAS